MKKTDTFVESKSLAKTLRGKSRAETRLIRRVFKELQYTATTSVLEALRMDTEKTAPKMRHRKTYG